MKKVISFLLACVMILGTISTLNVPQAQAEADEVTVPMTSNYGDSLTAIVLGAGDYYAVHFKSAAAFSGAHIMQWTPGGGEGRAEYTLAAYTWNSNYEASVSAEPVASADGVLTVDGAIDIRFDSVVPAGEYVLVFTVNTVNNVLSDVNTGVHLQTGVLSNGQSYFERYVKAIHARTEDLFAAFELITDGSVDPSDVFESIGIPKVLRLSSIRSDIPENIKAPYEDYAFRFTVPEGYSLKNLTLEMSPTWGSAADISSMQVTVYKWNINYFISVSGNVLDVVDIPTHNDMWDLTIDFDAELPSGTYLIVLKATGEGSIGFWWGTPESGLEDYAFAVYRSGGAEEIDLEAWGYLPYGSITMVQSDAEALPAEKLAPMTTNDYGTPPDGIILGIGNYYGVHFKTKNDFTGVYLGMQWTPVDTGGYLEYTLSAYKWDMNYDKSVSAEPAASVKGRTYGNHQIYVPFESAVDAGEYVLILKVDNAYNCQASNLYLQSGEALNTDGEYFERFVNAIVPQADDRFVAFQLTVVADPNNPSENVYDTINISKNVPMTSDTSGVVGEAIALGVAGNYYAVHFNAKTAFYGAFIPQWTDAMEGGYVDYTLSVYKWNTDYNTSVSAAPVESVDGRTVTNDDIGSVYFDSSVPAGEYVLVLKVNDSNNVGNGIHLRTGDAITIDGQEYFERFVNYKAGDFGERFAAFQLIITGGSADPADVFDTIEIGRWTVNFEGAENCDVTMMSGHTFADDKVSDIATGTTVAFKITPKDGYDASNISVTLNGMAIYPDAEGVYSVNIQSDVTVTVTGVTKKVYTVTIPENKAYTADKNTDAVEHGGTYTFTVNVTKGYKINSITSNVGNVENWTLSGDSIEVTISNVTDNLNITIDAAPISVTFEYSDEKLGTQKESVTATTDDYEEKTDDILSAPTNIPEEYTFDGWYVDDAKVTEDNISQYFTGHEDQTVTLTAKYTLKYEEAFKADASKSGMNPDDNGKWTWNLAVSWESIFDEYLGKATVIAGGFFYNNNDDNDVLSNITAADIEKLRNEFADKNDGSRIEYGQYKDDGSNTRAYFVEGDYAWDQADKTFTKNITNIPGTAKHCARGWFAVQFEDGHVEYYISEVIYSITATDNGRTM